MRVGSIRAMRILILMIASLCLLSGCGISNIKIPKLYKVAIQQGNVITQDMVDKLKPGMTRRQVAFVMGEPVIQDPFDDTKWVYLYSIDVPGVFSQESRLILFFDENDLLTVISGDYAPSDATAEQEEAANAASNSPS
ncbi:MAG: outer membrane protein assembly factor BamE [Pseudomonadota bacterium]|mgnify:FL=1|nr:outer membrane protein assembly factor BamE [Pseudomonadota bacterium]MEC7612464.1 outer membrane protein assembly factor BamE [Pseudomonadota bacterium]MEC7780534.1 outer membrane protein assembly factor BamE [Pseudomonadota bacterium]MEC7970034.1 outer membrane protein assembly factor BamE [Pseudomonadota bacterium]MEC7990747.1 outer membrane protein assembly factor BamE [Pseudomonadota bacterium]